MLQIYNTMTRQKEEFKPITPGKVKMYVCGVTVYDYCHIGHARCYVTFDIIYRYLKHLGFDVTYVRNFTDVDDKIINRANEQGIACSDVTEKFIGAFHEDMAALGVQSPTIEPKATEHISEMIQIIEKLQAKGMAYQAGSDVFYAVRKFDGYGKLSGKNIEDLESGARVDVMEAKNDPLDFALWKGAKPGEPKWPSPWGEGRPGWHIECSAMSMKHLSETFDIHGGGRDLIFPHHENEIAQSEACNGAVFSRHWIHNGFVNINTEKMSKSLNNFLTIRDVIANFPAEVLRMFILSAHYRSPLDYTEQNLTQALSGLERYYETKRRLEEHAAKLDPAATECDADILARVERLKSDFEESMCDDFNTAKVVGNIFEIVRDWNRLLDEGKPVSRACCETFFAGLREIHAVLGLFGSDPSAFFADMKSKAIGRMGVDVAEIEAQIVRRREARKSKDFKLSDEIRDELKARGIQLKDSPDGTTTWTVG